MDGTPCGSFRAHANSVMHSDKRWKLLSYDIRDPNRYRRVLKIMLGVGRRVQYSVYRAKLDGRGLERLRWELSKIMSAEDSLLIVDLCPRCAARVAATDDAWDIDEPAFRIIGADQAPAGGDATATEDDANVAKT